MCDAQVLEQRRRQVRLLPHGLELGGVQRDREGAELLRDTQLAETLGGDVVDHPQAPFHLVLKRTDREFAPRMQRFYLRLARERRGFIIIGW